MAKDNNNMIIMAGLAGVAFYLYTQDKKKQEQAPIETTGGNDTTSNSGGNTNTNSNTGSGNTGTSEDPRYPKYPIVYGKYHPNVTFLQRMLGVSPWDGIVGPATLKVWNKYSRVDKTFSIPSKTALENELKFIEAAKKKQKVSGVVM